MINRLHTDGDVSTGRHRVNRIENQVHQRFPDRKGIAVNLWRGFEALDDHDFAFWACGQLWRQHLFNLPTRASEFDRFTGEQTQVNWTNVSSVHGSTVLTHPACNYRTVAGGTPDRLQALTVCHVPDLTQEDLDPSKDRCEQIVEVMANADGEFASRPKPFRGEKARGTSCTFNCDSGGSGKAHGKGFVAFGESPSLALGGIQAPQNSR